jgi:hypothetical protein
MGFNAPDFLPHKAASFLADYIIFMFVRVARPQDALPRVLSDHRELGEHTDVVLVHRGDSGRSIATRWVYDHPSFSPFGIRTSTPGQCKTCLALLSMERPATLHYAPQSTKVIGVTMVCEACKAKEVFYPPYPKNNPLALKPDGNVVNWLYQNLSHSSVPRNTEVLKSGLKP